ncbi:MAG: hypothetical protein M1839_008433 [Geoglossum umbratile]|nr:MAG: hypothetical protein M1839_008433 [Geoglossum umbratile]
MKFSSAVVAGVVAAGLSIAAPLAAEKRADGPVAVTDDAILNYALTLEHLEDTFYRTGLSNFSESDFAAAGFDSKFYNNIKEVANDEKTHVEFLTKALTGNADGGFTPVKECKYSFPVTDVKSFVLVSSILEGVGVTAYLGAAAQILNKGTLTAAGSILTVEARHSAFLRAALSQLPFPQPFDVPLTLDEVFTLAAGFIVECPADNPPLPVKAFPSLVLDPTTPSPIVGDQEITILTPGYELKPADGNSPVFGAWITVTGPIFVDAVKVYGGFKVKVPKEVNGQSYVVLTGCNETVTDDTVAAGPAIVEVSCICLL